MVQERQLKAIVISDVVDSSIQIFADELIAIQRIKEDLNLIREELQRNGGSLVKSLGDGLLATFDVPTQALEFVQNVVRRLSERGRQSLSHRFGLHTGEIYVDGDDIIGQGVHLASRLQTVSPANGVAFLRSTYELIDPRLRRLAVSMGEIGLKGLPEPVHAYYLGQEELLLFAGVHDNATPQLETLLLDTPFDMVRPLGRSAQKLTLLLQERQRDRLAVMKLIPATSSLVEALQVEAACLDRLRHPRIPRVLDGFARAGHYCFVQEYIPGPSLHGSLDLLRRKQRLAELLRQVLQVLQVVHAAGLVHGDIHPANLIPAPEGGQLFLVDFSLLKARIGDRRDPSSGGLVIGSELGRPFFSAPERVRFSRLTPASDLYALGVTALSLYTGQDPSSLYDECQGCWQMEGLDQEVAGWLAPLLQDLPARRLQQATDALRLLDQPPGAPAALPPPGKPAVARGASVQPGVRKPELRALLVTTYGPMVELLLESQPSLIPAAQLPALQERLVMAGLAEVDVAEAFQRAQPPPSDGDGCGSAGDDAPAPVAAPAVLPPVAADEADSDRQLASLRQAIGPIADLIWTDELQVAAGQDPDRYRTLLIQAAVPEEIAAALCLPPAVAAPAEPQPTPLERNVHAVETESVESEDPRRLLVELVGPIGISLWERVADQPAASRPSALIALVETYGLDKLLIEELRRRLEPR